MKIITHSGSFHPDEVFAVAALKLALGEKVEVVRTRDPKKIETGDFVIDVGLKYDGEKFFDHHQENGAGKRPDGVPYASFGLVWKKFGQKAAETVLKNDPDFELGSEASKLIFGIIEKKLAEPIDLNDNGIGEMIPLEGDIYLFSLGHIIYSANPTWREKNISRDKIFLEMVDLAERILFREIKIAFDGILGAEKVEEAYKTAEDKKIIILDDNYNWIPPLSLHPEPLFAIEPSKDRTAFEVESVKENPLTFNVRKLFPKEWAGKRNEELQKLSGVSDAIFCHNAAFFAVAGSKDGAIALAKKAIER